MAKLDELKKENNGIEFLRSLVNAYGWRDEHLNDNKSPVQLVNEYKKYRAGEIDLDGNIYIDNGGAASLQIGYTYDLIQTVKFSPSFKIYLAYGLAEKIVYKLTGNVNLQTRVTAGLKTAQLEAKAKNGKANPPVAYRQSKMLQGRRIYGGSRTTGLFAGQNGRT